jgi:transposase
MPIKMSRDEIRAVYRQGEDAVVALIEMLIQRLNALEEEVEKLKGQKAKDSRNSSKPPSSDQFRKHLNLRQKTDLTTGGQPGHPGTTLQMSDKPDAVVDYAVEDRCSCGYCLDDVPVESFERRQEINIPQIKPTITEHRAQIKKCPRCGQVHKGSFPSNISAPVQYGAAAKAAGVYLNQYQLIPLERTAELLNHLFHLPISEGSLVTFSRQAFEGLETTEQDIVERIRGADVGHFDETGLYVEKKRGWLNVAGTQNLTRYFFHDRRGKEAMDAAGILPHFNGVAVHDGLKAYFLYDCKHALCNVHHLREMKFQVEQCQQKWAKDMTRHLLAIKDDVGEAKKAKQPRLPGHVLESHETKYDNIIQQGYEQNPVAPVEGRTGKRGRAAQSSTRNLLDRFKKYRSEVLLFMHDFKVPFDNNSAERDGRMVKTQQKISGCFRSRDGAHTFCRIRSFISTMRKQGHDVFESLTKIFTVSDGSVSLLPEQ